MTIDKSPPKKRYLSLYLPNWAIDLRFRGKPDITAPYVQTQKIKNRIEVMALNKVARKCGIEIGMTLATARAVSASLHVEDYDPEKLTTQLEKLADW
ncbi:MAG: DNA polymerase Y family protein, partial [Alphaproteobacteria bacterium]|nr:DNA polymerase Y family protein [Alphaproteobacteria bacterium]